MRKSGLDATAHAGDGSATRVQVLPVSVVTYSCWSGSTAYAIAPSLLAIATDP